MRICTTFILFALLSACVSFSHRFAVIEPCQCNGEDKLILSVPTHQWQGAPYGWVQTAVEYTISLPEKPIGHIKYLASQIQMAPATDENGKPVSIVSGYIEFDIDKKQLIVSLQTSQGDFEGNGSYPLN